MVQALFAALQSSLVNFVISLIELESSLTDMDGFLIKYSFLDIRVYVYSRFHSNYL